MHNGKIAIFGASGLVGSRLCESLYFNRRYDFRALIHSAGNAFRIAKYPMEIEQVNLLDGKQIYRSLRDCSVVVNCSRGDKCVMLQGLKNLIRAAEKRKIKKLIHISSVLIYGPNPPPESYSEDCQPDPQGNDYGIIKLKQDNMLLKRKHTFRSIILCPPNIYGPYSGFTLSVLNYFSKGNIALVDWGKNPCNLVHVDNLVLAIYKAIENDLISGERFFIRDQGEPTWKDFFYKFSKIIHKEIQFTNLESSLFEDGVANKNNILRLIFNSAKYFASPDFRKALSSWPLFNILLPYIFYRFNCLKPSLQEKLREKLSSSIILTKEPLLYDPNDNFVNFQKREVSHSIDKAKSILNYQPFLDLDSGLDNIKIWLKSYNLT